MPPSRPKRGALRGGNVFSERLRKARDERAMNQDQLAERAGLQPSAVSHFETGGRRPSFENLKRLADALSVSTDYLLGRTQELEGIGAPKDPLYADFQRLDSINRDLARSLIQRLARSKR